MLNTNQINKKESNIIVLLFKQSAKYLLKRNVVHYISLQKFNIAYGLALRLNVLEFGQTTSKLTRNQEEMRDLPCCYPVQHSVTLHSRVDPNISIRILDFLNFLNFLHKTWPFPPPFTIFFLYHWRLWTLVEKKPSPGMQGKNISNDSVQM